MLKKNSWIAALVLALSLTAFLFTGCVSPLKVEEDNEVYEEYPLDKGYNAWAGQVYQKGWAIGGIKFQGKGDAITVAKDLGYDIEMFQKATKLKIEMPDASYPRSGVDIIWGGEDETGDSTKGGGMWNQQAIAGGSGDLDSTFAKKDGNVLIIDLTKALKNYSAYTKAAKLKIVMQVNAPSYGDVEGLVQKAFLMIPATPPPPVGVASLTLPSNEMYWTNDFELVPRIRPDNATNQAVTWAIQGWEPGNGYVGTDTKIDLTSGGTIEDLIKKINWKQEEYTLDDAFWPNVTSYKNVRGTLAVPKDSGRDSLGTVTVYAIVKQGTLNKDGTFSDLEKTLSVQIKDPPPLTYKVGGVENTTIFYGAIDNGGVTGGEMVLTSDGKGYTATYSPTGGQYANSIAYVKVTLPEKLDNYKQFTCTYNSDNCDLTGKSVRIKAMMTKPPRSYNPGPYLATISFPGGGEYKKDVPLTFDFYKDNAEDADGTSNKGIYNKGKGADLSAVGTDAGNAGRFTDKDDDGNNGNIKDAKTIYFWILPWGDKGTKYTITNINFVHK